MGLEASPVKENSGLLCSTFGSGNMIAERRLRVYGCLCDSCKVPAGAISTLYLHQLKIVNASVLMAGSIESMGMNSSGLCIWSPQPGPKTVVGILP